MNKRKVVLAAAIFAALGTNVSFAALEIGDNSIAEGNQAIATGSNSIAVGTNAVATGDNLTGDVIKQKLAENQAQLAEIERLTKLVNDGTLEFNQKYAIYNRVKAAQEKIAANNELINNTLRPNYDTAKGNYNAFKPEYDETVRQMNERLAYINKLNFSLLTTDPNGLETLATELKQKSEDGFPQVNNNLDFYKTYIQNYIKAKGDLDNMKADAHFSDPRYNYAYIKSNNYTGIDTANQNLVLRALYDSSVTIDGYASIQGSNNNFDFNSYVLNTPTLNDTQFNNYMSGLDKFDALKDSIAKLPLTGYITAEVKANMIDAVLTQKERFSSIYNAKHEQYLYEQIKSTNPTQALVHLQNKLKYEEALKTQSARIKELADSQYSTRNAYNSWYKENVTDVEQSNTLTVKTLSDQYKAAIADKQAKLDDLDKKVKDADAAIKAKERENAQLQPTAQELKDAADAERVKQKLDADKAALEKAKQDLALNDLRNVGRNAISVGNNSLVTGTNAIGIGTDGLITGEDAIGIGRANTITGTKSVALGTNNSIQSNNAFAIGNNINIPTGFDNAVVIGHNSAPKAPTAVDGVTPEATVSFGSPGHERQLVNVAKGALTETSTDAINGAQLYSVKNDLLTEINKKGTAVKVIDGQNTTVTTGVDGDATTYAVNVSADAIKGAVQADLDAKANKDASNLTGSDVTKWQEKLGNGTVEAGNTGLTTGDTVYNATKDLANKDLSNITKDGETVIKNLAGEAVKVAEGTNVTVTSETKDGTTTYTVNAVGNGKVAAGDTGLVTGDTVYKELDKTNNAINNKADTDLGNITDDGKTVIRDVAKGSVKVVNGENTTVTTGVDGNATTYAVNVSTDTIKGAIQPELDKKANTDASNLTGGDVTKWQEKLGNGTVEAGNTGLTTGDTVYNATKDLANKDLSNITDGGKTVIRDVAKGSVKVVNGENTTVTTGVDGDATTYAVNVSTDTIKGAIQPELDKKANTDASNLTNSDIKKWQDALGNGSVEQGNTGLVTGDTVYNVVKNVAGNPLAVSYDSSDKDVITLKGTEGTIISNVKNGEVAAGSMDAVNGGQLYETNTRIDQAVGRLSSDIKHVGAVSAALAGLHPQDFDEDYKFTVAAARGSYDGASAYALGAFYRPNSDLMFNVASTLSSGKKAYTMGVSYKFGTSNKKSVLAENAALQDKVNRLEQVVNTIANSPLFQLKDARKPFPDVPRDRWDAKAVETLHANGIVEGYPDGTYKGEETMTRSEYAQMVYALADKLTQPNK